DTVSNRIASARRAAAPSASIARAGAAGTASWREGSRRARTTRTPVSTTASSSATARRRDRTRTRSPPGGARGYRGIALRAPPIRVGRRRSDSGGGGVLGHLEVERRPQQRARVGLARPVEDLLDGPGLHHPAAAHHQHL